MDLAGATALVTGGAVRVGREIALELARAGADVLLHYRSSEGAARATAEAIRALGRRCTTIAGDLGRPADLEAVAAAGRPADVLVNSASVFPRQPLDALTVDAWDEVMDVNLRAPFFLAARIGLAMRERGRGVIVNIADYAAKRPYPGYLPYCISKAALVAATEGLARTLAPDVRVNTVAPGTVLWGEDAPEEQREKIRRATPLKREGAPEDVARAVRFLVEGSDFITGAFLTVDGGRLIA